MRDPPVVVLSLPRSGSSWVGDMLGQAPDAAYLREPLTQAYLAAGHQPTIAPIDRLAIAAAYRTAAAGAFAGLPNLLTPSRVARYPEQWTLAERRHKRLVIKEVNPYLAEWLVHEYRPRLIYLLRHPAAVALSYARQGWLPGPDPWRRAGETFGRVHAAAWLALRDYAQVQFVNYDSVCERPLEMYAELFSFAGLTWTAAAASYLESQTTSDDAEPYGLHRVSRKMVRNWEGKLAPKDLAALRAGYYQQAVPWFQSDEDW